MIRGDEMKRIIAGGKFVSENNAATQLRRRRRRRRRANGLKSAACRLVVKMSHLWVELLQHLKEICLQFITQCSSCSLRKPFFFFFSVTMYHVFLCRRGILLCHYFSQCLQQRSRRHDDMKCQKYINRPAETGRKSRKSLKPVEEEGLEALNGEGTGNKSCHNNTTWLLHPMRQTDSGVPSQWLAMLQGHRGGRGRVSSARGWVALTKSLNSPAEGHGGGGNN